MQPMTWQRSLVAGFVAVAWLCLCVLPAWSAPVRLGIMGDSGSAGQGGGLSFPNWPTQLVNSGQVTIPPTGNQAVDAATTADLPAQRGPIISLVQAAQLDYTVLAIGTKDATNMSVSVATTHQLDPNFTSTIIQRLETTIIAIAAAGNVHQMIANIQDIFAVPGVQQAYIDFNVSQADQDTIRQAIIDTNVQIRALAAAHHIPMFDTFKFYDDVGTHPLTLAGVTIDTLDLYAADHLHSINVIHGLVANAFVYAMNHGYGDTLSPLSDQQILLNSGRTPLVAGPTYFDVSPYVVVPEPSTLMLAGLGVVALLGVEMARGRAAMIAV